MAAPPVREVHAADLYHKNHFNFLDVLKLIKKSCSKLSIKKLKN